MGNDENQGRRRNPLRKVKLATMRSQANGAAAGLPIDSDEDLAMYDERTFDREYPRWIRDAVSNATANDGQVVQGRSVLKQCEIADIDGNYISLFVWTDRCAVANFITPEAVRWLGLEPEETEDQSLQFDTLNGTMTTPGLVTVHWKGRSTKGSSSFHVIPEGSKVGPLVVGDGFLDQYGDDVFADLAPAAVTIASRKSKSESSEQERLRGEAREDAMMLEKNRQDEKKKKTKTAAGHQREGSDRRNKKGAKGVANAGSLS